MQGVGAMLMPFAHVLPVIIAAIIAKEGWEKVVSIFMGWQDRRAESHQAAARAAYTAYLQRAARQREAGEIEDEEILSEEEWQERTKTEFKNDPLGTLLRVASDVQSQAD